MVWIYISYDFIDPSGQNFGINMRSISFDFAIDTENYNPVYYSTKSSIEYIGIDGASILISGEFAPNESGQYEGNAWGISYRSDNASFNISFAKLYEYESYITPIDINELIAIVEDGFDSIFDAFSDDIGFMAGSPRKDKIIANDAAGTTVWAKGGNDKVWSGDGATRFMFRSGDGKDKIFDFNPDMDVIELRTFRKLDSWKDIKKNAKNKDGDTILKVGKYHKIKLIDVKKKELDDDNFLFTTSDIHRWFDLHT